ncbi:DUF1636 family protein [Tropicimonas isoalkanivorans]|uniref:Predicted metal-binding protein n=1 Tax=Tropicimonas isoalkanivorans TaxID=441112 RepID=A0A1I1LC29_9RHOB|nr:DUF1636 domain-containing protein [Tropicimonas isoalkanivorans]SFC70589.1 Predicted metal-binding protein [Tropicimonas isoalkanivorans]
MTTITICTTCRNAETRESKAGDPTGEAFLDHTRAAVASHDGLTVRGTACLMGCDHGCNAAISAHGKMTYVLGRFDGTPEDAAALADYAGKHAASATGAVPYRTWPQGVKGHFISRVPPLD